MVGFVSLESPRRPSEARTRIALASLYDDLRGSGLVTALAPAEI